MSRFGCIFFLVFSSSAFSYMGPGMGGGILALVFGFIVAFFAVFLGTIYYPIKRKYNEFLSRRKMKIDEQLQKETSEVKE